MNKTSAHSKAARSATLPLCGVAAVAIALVLSLSPPSANATTFMVSVGDGGFRFTPSSVTIQVGDTVQWDFVAAGHTTTSGAPGQPTGFWDSGFLNPGDTFSFTFKTAGTFPYFCSAHGACCGMTGSVIVSSPTPTPTPTPSSTPAQSLNISTRGDVETGDDVMIGGFIITGTQTKQLILRALGPSLSPFGVTGVLADPVLELHNSSSAVIATNDNWKTNSSTDQTTIINAGLNLSGGAAISDAESVLVQTLAPGSYTAIVSGAAGGTGIGLVEVYDVDSANGGQLANISTRGSVGTVDNRLIGGFILGPAADGATSVIVRAIGPSLAANGVSNPLLDPMLEIADSSGNIIASNDNWADGPDAATIMADNLAPTNASESALLLTPGPGAYTAIVSGVADTTGIGLAEVYNLQ